MASHKGLKRLIFLVVFLIPVAWYLFLQVFGDNKFSIEIVSSIPDECGTFERISIVYKGDSLSVSGVNYLNRVTYHSATREIPTMLDEANFFECTEIMDELALVNKEGVWGTYKLSREGVDRLLAELDILLLQKSYGQGTSR